MIRVAELSRRYGDVLALDRISFAVGPGEVLGFLGPNGAGKTTTMKILTGFLAPSGGEVRIDGRAVDGRDGEFRGLLGYLPENAPAYPEMRVVDYLRFVARVRGIGGRAGRVAVDRALGRVGLELMARREIRALSKGYRQRVGLAQSLVHDPPILILDEPTSGLDPNQVVEIRRLIRELGRDKTVIFSSHVMQEVQAVATRVVILDRGRIVADGAPQALGDGGRRTRLRASGVEPAVLAAHLAGLAEVAEARPLDDGAVELLAADGAGDGGIARAAAARAVVEAGWSLVELRPAAADLESIFRRMTGGNPGEPPPA